MAKIQCGAVEFSNIEAVIFDKDGTLADSQNFLRTLGQKRGRLIDAQVPGVLDPLLMAYGFDGHDLDPAGLLAVGSRRENEIASAAYVAETGRAWMEALEMVRSAFAEADKVFQQKAKETPLFEPCRPMLQQLAEAGVKIGILSSDTTENVKDFVAHYDLEKLVTLQMGIDDGPTKPEPILLHKACYALNVLPHQTLVIGDSLTDFKLARAAGAAGYAGVTWGWNRPVNLGQPDVILSQATEIQADTVVTT